jgi:hypothetical protein
VTDALGEDDPELAQQATHLIGLRGARLHGPREALASSDQHECTQLAQWQIHKQRLSIHQKESFD